MINDFASVTLTLLICFASTPSWSQEVERLGESNQISAIQDQHGLKPAVPLMQRVGATPDSVIAIFREAGMSPKPYTLSKEEEQRLNAAFAILPPLHQSVLKQRLRSVSFLTDMPNTALTSTLNPHDPYPLFDIAIRADILKQSAAEWMTEKESSCFESKHFAFSLRADVGNITAIQYVFLHEATHVVDATLAITAPLRPSPKSVLQPPATPFTAAVWEDLRIPVLRYRDEDLMAIRFRPDGKVMDASNMKRLYEALGRTPFVSLYGSSAPTEDLAEYLTVYHLTQKLHQPFRILVSEDDQEVLVHDPMNSKITRSRFESMRQFYRSPQDDLLQDESK